MTRKENRWVPQRIDFNDLTNIEVEGVLVQVIPLDRLIEYKVNSFILKRIL